VAIYRCEIKTVSRSQGASSVAGAAYRAGLDLTNELTGERHDYTRKTGVLASGIVAPTGAPAWAQDAAKLWNAAEAAETRKNSVVAREFLISLPHELTEGQRVELARDLTAELVGRFSFAAMFAVHTPDKHADERNHHVHILATTRAMGAAGLGAKTRELDDRKSGAVDEVRDRVATTINRHLERAGLASRVDHRSLMAQQLAAADAGDFAKAATLERTPEPKVGRAATAAARRGHRSPRAERAQRVRTDNAGRLDAQADRFRELRAQAAAEGRLAQVDEQALHAQALLDVAFAQARKRQAASQPSTPNRSPHHGPQRNRAPALTGHRVHSRSHPTGRQPRGLEPLPAVRTLDRAAAFRQHSGHAGGVGGFAPFARHVLRPNAPGHNDTHSGVQRVQPSPGRIADPKPKRVPAPRKARATAPTSARSRITGDGSRESERVAHLASMWLAAVEDSIGKIIRQALAWSQQHTDPLPRSLAKNFLNAVGEAQVAAFAHENITEQLAAARRQRGELAKRVKQGPAGLKGLDRFTAALGWSPKSLRELHDAHKQSQDLVVMVKGTEQHTAEACRRSKAEAELHRQRLLDAYEKAHPPTGPAFPKRDPAPAPEPAPRARVIPRPTPGANTEPPRLRPPRGPGS
jgi:hypothetical protein